MPKSHQYCWKEVEYEGLGLSFEFFDLKGNSITFQGIKCIKQAFNTYGLNSLIPSLAQNCPAFEFLELKGNWITSGGIKCIK